MNIRWQSQFKKDYKRMLKRGKVIDKLDDVIKELAVPNLLPEKYRDHFLKGNYTPHRHKMVFFLCASFVLFVSFVVNFLYHKGHKDSTKKQMITYWRCVVYAGYKECHIEPDWLLIYGYEILDDEEQQLLLVRTGSHSDLFA